MARPHAAYDIEAPDLAGHFGDSAARDQLKRMELNALKAIGALKSLQIDEMKTAQTLSGKFGVHVPGTSLHDNAALRRVIDTLEKQGIDPMLAKRMLIQQTNGAQGLATKQDEDNKPAAPRPKYQHPVPGGYVM